MSEKEIRELVRAEQNRYAKEWRAKNPDKVKAAKQRYWEKRVRERLAKEGQTNV